MIIKSLLICDDPKRYGDKKPSMAQAANVEEEARVMKILSGLTFEIVLERALRAALYPGLFRPEPVCVDGVWMSPDGIDPHEWAIHEFKLTWYSKKKPCPTDKVFWPWVIQIKSYSRAIGALVAYLTVYFINTDYAPPRPSPPVTYRLEFTAFELDQCWTMVINHGKLMGILQ